MRKVRTVFGWLAAAACWGAASPALAVTVDDFAVSFPPPGSYETDASGTGGGVQSPIAVLGGTRDTLVVTNDPGSPTSATTLANPSPPPFTDVVHLVTGADGGLLQLHYPQPAGYDVTLGSLATIPSVLTVRSTLMVAGGRVEVDLEDASGVVGTGTLGTISFAGEHPYLFFIDPNGFAAGLDLQDIQHIRVRVVQPTGVDSEVSDISIDPLAAQGVSWGRATTFRSTGGSGPENPLMIFGFNPQPEPPAVWDLSDPMRPTVTFEAQPMSHRIYLGFEAQAGINPCAVPGPDGFSFSVENARTLQVMVEVSRSDGMQLDPASLVGFNPQPEPPGFGMPFGYSWEFGPGGGGAGAGVAETTTIAFQVLENGDPLTLAVVERVPALPVGGLAWLAGALGAAALVTLLAVRRRDGS